MDQDFHELYEILDCQIEKRKAEEKCEEFLSALERKYKNRNSLFVAWSVIPTWVLQKGNWKMF